MRGKNLSRLGLALMLVACGARSGLYDPQPSDHLLAPPDAGVDAGAPIRCVELPLNGAPNELTVDFVAQILSADVLFLVDVTGSMEDEIDQIRELLRDEIAPGLAREIPDLQLAVARFADFPLPEFNYGDSTDQLYRSVQPSTSDIAAVQQAVDALPLQGGRDGPEAIVEALYLTATGEGLGNFVPPGVCPMGTTGYPCFRRTGTRIIMTFTDAPSHEGPGNHDPYHTGAITPAPHTYEQALDALHGIGAKVLGLYSGVPGSPGRADLEAIARDTGAARTDGTPLVFDIGVAGTTLAPSVVAAAHALVDEVPIDVDVAIENLDQSGAIDASRFVRAIVARESMPPEGAINAGDRFEAVRPGTRVVFSIMLANDFVTLGDTPQEFFLRVVLRADRVTRLSELTVRIVVPARGGGVACGP